MLAPYLRQTLREISNSYAIEERPAAERAMIRYFSDQGPLMLPQGVLLVHWIDVSLVQRRVSIAPARAFWVGTGPVSVQMPSGVDPTNVHVAGLCTATHNDWLWSYRREGARAGRMLAVIRRA